MEKKDEFIQEKRFGRVSDFVGKGKMIPVSRSTWYSWVKSGRAPKPHHLSPRVAVYDMAAISQFLRTLTST
ncbi:MULTISPECIES: helix-turn-helix transcriptional regulator [unclassified Rhizobium]|uniref:helix-turn-helix transcriptional regulator n=1 Tax=unclassified Rhizobium TaxID=2613769 RepID=UPI001781009B|nr:MULTISPECIES: AlpA family phage regulatory protein [unclassified Rhizobium]MBD8685995.1 AlpA family phage regulatory protein [Rhizobium sp. CFBP 13644]MBD8690332.1 AlpA family phage regulatory protein [Rhizobium sp. CFBP 13717]